MNLKTLSLSLILSLTSIQASALSIPENEDDWYYQLGGERAVYTPPSYETNSLTIGGSANWGAGFSCSAFNPVLGVANTLNNVKSGIDSMQSQLVSAATSGIASLPLLILQRANPGLYDMFMNSLGSAEERVNLATKSCESAMTEIGNGQNPYYDWVQISRGRDWKTQIGNNSYGSSSTDVIEAEKQVEQSNGNNGFEWIGGQLAAGKGQPPAKIPTDLVKAGYNQTLNRNATDISPAPSQDDRLAQLWPTPAAAMQWSKSVLGEEQISTYQGHPVNTTAGRGLTYEIGKEEKEVRSKLTALVYSNDQIKPEDLKEVSTSNVLITYKVIDSLKNLGPIEKDMLTARLAQEVATARNVERALYVRRLIQSGLQEPNVNASGVAYEQSKAYLDRLDYDIEKTLFETEVNKKLASTTSETIKRLSGSELTDKATDNEANIRNLKRSSANGKF